jgi:hypothetical protein
MRKKSCLVILPAIVYVAANYAALPVDHVESHSSWYKLMSSPSSAYRLGPNLVRCPDAKLAVYQRRRISQHRKNYLWCRKYSRACLAEDRVMMTLLLSLAALPPKLQTVYAHLSKTHMRLRETRHRSGSASPGRMASPTSRRKTENGASTVTLLECLLFQETRNI